MSCALHYWKGEIMGYPREVIEQVKEAICIEAAEMRRINKIVPVTGKRLQITQPDRQIDVVFYPSEKEHAPLILGFHGGGFLFGGCAMNDAMWSETGAQLGAAVASVEYRMSPDYQWREALADAYDAVVYFQNNAEEYGINKNDISVMGCSAGANLAASVCLYANQQKNHLFQRQILMYPFLDCATDPDSKGKGSLEGPIMYIFNELHCKPEEAKVSLVSPVFAEKEELEGLPKTIICYADQDNLKAEGQKYANMLQNAGISVDDMVAVGMPHGFYEYGFGKISEGEMDFLGDDAKEMIRNGKFAQASQECLEFIKEHF